MSEEAWTIDPNSADLEELQRLPGVGPALAQRIVDARPLTGPDDLRRVPGLGEAARARLSPHLHFVAPEPTSGQTRLEPPAEEPSATAVPLALETASAEPSAPTPAGSRAPVFTRSETLWLVLGTGILSTVLAVMLTLAILAGINGSLSVARNRTLRQLETEASTLQRGMDDLSSSLQGLDGRLAALEGLSGRMTAVESEVEGLRQNVGDALRQVEAMQSTVDGLEAETARLTQRSERFDAFLEGLLQLLAPVSPSATPTPVP